MLAAQPWKDPTSPYADVLQKIDYSAFHQINFRKTSAVWADAASGPPVELFHLGRYFLQPVSIRIVEGGNARELVYRQGYFDMPEKHVAHLLPDGIGFAGFRVMADDQTWDWLAFLGASYFRSPGASKQYGMSCRGLAIDTGLPSGEEFPRFSTFWLQAGCGHARSGHHLRHARKPERRRRLPLRLQLRERRRPWTLTWKWSRGGRSSAPASRL